MKNQLFDFACLLSDNVKWQHDYHHVIVSFDEFMTDLHSDLNNDNQVDEYDYAVYLEEQVCQVQH